MGIVKALNVANIELICRLPQGEEILSAVSMTAQLQQETLVIEVQGAITVEGLEQWVSLTVSEPRTVERLMGVVRKSQGRFKNIELRGHLSSPEFGRIQEISSVVQMTKLHQHAILIEKIAG